MYFDIRTAALDDLTEQRLRLATSLLGAQRVSARIGPWDGGSCHLLVTDTDNAYGRHALALATRRGTGVMALGEPRGDLPVTPVSPLKTASEFARALQEQLGELTPRSSTSASGTGSAPPVLCSLAMLPLRGAALDLHCHGYTVHLRPEAGLVHAATCSDLFAVIDGLCGTDCRIEAAAPGSLPEALPTHSLAAFLLRAAFRAGERLPAFPPGRYHLDACPDLGSLSTPMGAALRIARSLSAQPLDTRTRDAADLHDVDHVDFNASLWGFAAADLLRGACSAPDAGAHLPGQASPPPPRARRTFWSSLARRAALLRG